MTSEKGRKETIPIVDQTQFELVQLQVVTRHGARTPLSESMPDRYKRWNWVCRENNDPDLWIEQSGIKTRFNEYKSRFENLNGPPIFGGSCGKSQLTVAGESQLEEFGKFLRARYIDNLKVLDDKYDPKKIYLRSTDTSRTIWSTRQLVQGLYPLNSKRSPDDKVEIHVKQGSEENMYPRQCPVLDKMKAEFSKSNESMNRKQIAKGFLYLLELGVGLGFWCGQAIRDGHTRGKEEMSYPCYRIFQQPIFVGSGKKLLELS
eukprot:TRINITY_DN8647_c0_g1_i8.p1 TRINITY_DN8647_c0_g1~~TRINITY_DN8647_c0_g1_i8.p1  ORF type:complete len:261 (+),score=30.19 TRINITY_DN8647_c0_g1_i8:56-838(+)